MHTKHPKTIKWFGLASIITITVSFFIYYKANVTRLTNEEKQALVMYNETKSALDSMSIHLNKGQNSLLQVKQFAQVKEKIFKK